MSQERERTNVLITVKTYPHLPKKHDERVCVAGITDQHEWVRLFPVDYRYRPEEQKFEKYQWIDIELEPGGYKNDVRKESRRPHLDSMRFIGKPLSSAKNWESRRAIIDQMPHHTANELKQLYDEERVSLGIVRPTSVLDLEMTPTDRRWTPGQEENLRQLRLFGDPPKPLRKIPFEFRYVFQCEDSDKLHRAMISDWELGILFLKEEARLGSEEAAAQSVRKKFLDEICHEDRDTRFFMGTTFPHNSWIVIGTFYPRKSEEHQEMLF